MIRVQREDFDLGAEIAKLGAGDLEVGGIAAFVGRIPRNKAAQGTP
jgi:molybdopterin synthase catalytic subunit